MRLTTDLCVIRDWHPDDKSALASLANNRKVWRNLTHLFPHPYAEAQADEWFSHLASLSEVTHWAIEVDARLAGGIGLMIGEGVYAKTAQMGYWLGEPFWGRGIATAAVKAVAAHAMPRYGLCRIEAAVFSWNPASGRVLEKAGFIREGVRRRSIFKDGRIIDSVMYALTDAA